MQGIQDYCVARCNGCEQQQFCTISSSTEDMDEFVDSKTGKHSLEYIEIIKQFPAVNTNYEKPPMYLGMPHELRSAYDETYRALCEDLPKLASIGIRMNIEIICTLHDVKGKWLPQRIEALYDKQIISIGMKEMLLSVKEFGDKGAHTIEIPKPIDLQAAWNALNILMLYIYGTKDTNDYYKVKKAFQTKKRKATPDAKSSESVPESKA
ncbi:MAG TPA: DUF4145 domain-containing protein [Candidatus Saccharimonadales bacterium]|nr:DUF4145 domain-containing protein [Candidatus Saccharimonadales bacterium]